MNYEPEETEALEIIIPKYVTSILYGALVEAIASENGARMQAMGFRDEQCAGHDRSSDLAVQPCASGLHYTGADRDHSRSKCNTVK